ncbi:MAG: YkgJ family cysteine cluster protein [Tepidisphaeraceae bacterium]
MSADNLCEQCSGLCCRYFALQIDTPKTAREFDDIRWYLCHENVIVYIEKRKWYVGILNKCKHLMPDNRCGIYHDRPRICRGYSTDHCDYHGGDYGWEVLFTSAEQLREYAEKKLGRPLVLKPRVNRRHFARRKGRVSLRLLSPA